MVELATHAENDNIGGNEQYCKIQLFNFGKAKIIQDEFMVSLKKEKFIALYSLLGKDESICKHLARTFFAFLYV